AQCLRPLLDAYDIDLVCHLVGDPSGQNAPEPELLLDLSCYDSTQIAPHYGLSFPDDARRPDAGPVDLAGRILAGLDPEDFVDVAPLAGEGLWSGSDEALQAVAERHAPAEPSTLARRRQTGTDRRTELGHYSGAMFHYGGEWYWGVDRLCHLEARLTELGTRRQSGSTQTSAHHQPDSTRTDARHQPGATRTEGVSPSIAPARARMIAPRPDTPTGPHKDTGTLTLETYPSIRSPYTAAAFDATVALARETGVPLVVRPVLPMVMRGVPATRAKGVYIFTDAAREARARGITDWGKFRDPIGNPVQRGYSLYPWADSQGRGVEFISAFLHAAFREGVNTNTNRGLRHVVESAGLPWSEAAQIVGNDDWIPLIEANRQAMYSFGLWGVPSFRLLNAQGEPLVHAWGQDRLWLIAKEIQRALG
ncbi:MAG: DsbA family protein, partial [Gammaproteobacteria bacterium]|nr:DsbA family protein [Gammaproteobacteria bacterium]